MLKVIFWVLLSLIIYTYFVYPILLFLISLFFKKKRPEIIDDSDLPAVTLLIAAYNEKENIEEKIKNSFEIDYPSEKLKFVWVTDGSNDGTVEELSRYQNINILHQKTRLGKTHALNRAIKEIDTPYIVFSDANTYLNPSAIKELIKPFKRNDIGCVAGEKRIITHDNIHLSGWGEGFYWSYESLVKNLESKTGTTISAAGELYAIRTGLYVPPKSETITDDFVISISIALMGYKIFYQPKAVAKEFSSLNLKEERKRKIRIASGNFQVLFKYGSLLNIFKHFMLSFQYISHKVLRWLAVPIALAGLIIVGFLLFFNNPEDKLYFIMFGLQVVFYLLSLVGLLMINNSLSPVFRWIFMPFYFLDTNISMIKGFILYLNGKHNVRWEKAKRSNP